MTYILYIVEYLYLNRDFSLYFSQQRLVFLLEQLLVYCEVGLKCLNIAALLYAAACRLREISQPLRVLQRRKWQQHINPKILRTLTSCNM